VATARTAGRAVGVLTLTQMLAGVMVNFVLTAPLFGSPGFLVNAADHPSQIASSVVLGLAMAAIPIGIAVTAFPIIRQDAQGMALSLLALASASLAITAVEQTSVMSMLSLSEAYARAGAAEREALQGLRLVVASHRNWSHYVARAMDGVTILALYGALFRSRLVPRGLAAFGMAASALQVVAIAMPFFGHAVVFPMLAPLGVSQLVLALWLIAKGFRGPAIAAGERAG
jgi:hypothetical protein